MMDVNERACGRCGQASEGLPPGLEALVEQRAREVYKGERQREEAALARAAAEEELGRVVSQEAETGEKLGAWRRQPTRGFAAAALNGLLLITPLAFVAWLVLGAPFHFFLFSAIGVSPAAYVACPAQCEGCSGPGRVMGWGYKGPFQDNKGRMGYALLCTNPRVDVDRLSEREVQATRNQELQPLMVSGFTAFFAEGACLAVLIGLVGALRAPGMGRRLRASEERRLAGEMERLRRRHAELRATLDRR
jgi:hypothetical protein